MTWLVFCADNLIRCSRQPKRIWKGLVLLSLGFSFGCVILPETEAQNRSPKSEQNREKVSVDIAIARTDILRSQPEYTGTTQPLREITLRSRVEGRLLSLNVEVGDRIRQGEVLGQLDDGLLRAVVTQAQAELAAQKSEVARAESEVNDAQIQVEVARVQLQQVQTDTKRKRILANEGAISEQEAELAQTELQTAEQTLRSAQSQVDVRQQVVAATKGRVAAQEALIKQQQERRSYTLLTSPITGFVLQKIMEPGDLAQPGSEILRLGDFQQIKVLVQVSELELAKIQVGQSVQVRLDAFPEERLTGKVSNISPAADPTSRLVPIEVYLSNPGEKFASGLLARVRFTQETKPQVVIPQTALTTGEGKGQGIKQSSSSQREGKQPEISTAIIFVINDNKKQISVIPRMVRLGRQINGQVEIQSGLEPGERFVLRSTQPLKAGDLVQPSFLSPTEQESQP